MYKLGSIGLLLLLAWLVLSGCVKDDYRRWERHCLQTEVVLQAWTGATED